MRLLRRMLADRRGATAIEYGLICALIVVPLLAALTSVSGATTSMYGGIRTKVAAVM